MSYQAQEKYIFFKVRWTIYTNFRLWPYIGDMSHIVPHKHTICPTFGLLGSGHPITSKGSQHISHKDHVVILPHHRTNLPRHACWDTAMVCVLTHHQRGERARKHCGYWYWYYGKEYWSKLKLKFPNGFKNTATTRRRQGMPGEDNTSWKGINSEM